MSDIRLLVILSATVVFLACNERAVKTAPISGYKYIVYDDQPGRMAEVGQYVYFQMDIYDDAGKLLQSYRNQKQMPSIQVADITNPLRAKNPLVDVMGALSLEDSVGILIPKDSIPDLPMEYQYVKNLEYRIKVKDILTEEDFQERMIRQREEEEQRAASFKERIPEIEDLAAVTLRAYKEGSLGLEETTGGVKYIIHELGDGDKPQKNWMTTVQYRGMLVSDGSVFDSSFEKGRGYTFRIETGNAIRGWHEAIPNFPVGTKASIFIPSELGYGSRGFPPDIPANAELYFYVEVEDSFY